MERTEHRTLELLAAFAGLLQAEWHNGNMPEGTYERLNADLQGVRIAIQRELSDDERFDGDAA